MKGVAYDRKETEYHKPHRPPPGLRDGDPHGQLRPYRSGFFKQGATDTAADKMMKVLEAEAATQKTAI